MQPSVAYVPTVDDIRRVVDEVSKRPPHDLDPEGWQAAVLVYAEEMTLKGQSILPLNAQYIQGEIYAGREPYRRAYMRGKRTHVET